MIQLTATHSCPSCLRTWMNLKFQNTCDPRCGHRSSSEKLLGGVSLCLSTTTELAQDRTAAMDITSIKRTTTSSQCATYQAASTATFCTPSVRICIILHRVRVQFTVGVSKSELLRFPTKRSPMEQRNDLRAHSIWSFCLVVFENQLCEVCIDCARLCRGKATLTLRSLTGSRCSISIKILGQSLSFSFCVHLP